MKHFEEILKALDAETQLLADDTNWEFYKATYKTPVGNIVAYYLYLKARALRSEASAQNLAQWNSLAEGSSYHLVLTPSNSLADQLNHAQQLFKALSAKTSKQLLEENLLRGLATKPIPREEFYLDSSICLEDRSIEPDASKYLSRWIKKPTTIDNKAYVGVVTAPGGVGKTTLARILCSELETKNNSIIPILIESDQWRDLVQSNFDLKKVWNQAVSRRFENASKLLDNSGALKVLIREGLFLIIFDGFDELCVTNDSGLKPAEIISELVDMVSSDEDKVSAKVIITSRETYWKTIAPDLDEIRNDLEIFELQGFDNDQKKRYFEKRLKSPEDRDISLRLAKQIGGAIAEGTPKEPVNKLRLSGVPFVLDLIATYVKDNPEAKSKVYSPDALNELLLDVCRRENKRQELNTDQDKQMELFEELFREYPQGFSLSDFAEYLNVICSISDQRIITKFANHHFLTLIGKDRLSAKYEILKVYFIARFLATRLQQISTTGSNSTLLRTLAKQRSGNTQIIDWVVDQLSKLDDSRLISSILNAQKISQTEEIDVRIGSSMALFHLIYELVENKFPVDKFDKIERSNYLSKLLAGVSDGNGKTVIRDKTIVGQIRSFDFSHFIFEECNFTNVEFRSCIFSKDSAFVRCRFDGTLEFSSCSNASDSTFNANITSPESEVTISTLMNSVASDKTRMILAEDALSRAVKKFKGDNVFTTIQYRRRLGGFKPGNPFNKRVWDCLIKKKVIFQHPISSVKDGGLHVSDEKEIRKEFQSFFDNGVFGRKLKEVLEDILLHQ